MLLETLSNRSRVAIADLEGIAASASKRYKVYPIAKRTGGVRLISQPSRTLKVIQRWIVRHVLSASPVHPSATAYEKGSSILDNALRHVGTNYTTRLDFKDFFPSFDDNSIFSFLNDMVSQKSAILTEKDIAFAVKILCKDGRLTIGAPSSPKLTNIMMFDFDKDVTEHASIVGYIYSRYADDIFISGYEKEIVKAGEAYVRSVLSERKKPMLRLNEKKSIYLSRASHRSITGLVLTPDGKVSLGRERKREIKSLIHRVKENGLNPVDRARLAGLIAFSNAVEPSFLVSLSQKYQMDALTWSKQI